MKVRVPKLVFVEVDVSLTKVGRYLGRTGWTLVQLGEWSDDVLGSFRIARWEHPCGEKITLRDDDEARPEDPDGMLVSRLKRISEVERRPVVDVALDVSREQE